MTVSFVEEWIESVLASDQLFLAINAVSIYYFFLFGNLVLKASTIRNATILFQFSNRYQGKGWVLSMLHSVCCHLTEFRRSGAGWGVATSIVLNGAFCFWINDDLGCSWSVFFSHSSFDSLPDRLLYNMFNEHDIVSSECSWQSWINMHHPRKDNDSFYSLHHERLPCT